MILGRRNYYRLARFLWIDARRDGANTMDSNGEFAIQSAIAKLAARTEASVFFDIGANIGEYSAKLLAKAASEGVGDSLRMFSFEPNPTCVAAINKRLEALPNGQCGRTVAKIVTDQPGRAKFFVTGETSGSSSLRVDAGTQQVTEIEVDCITFDEFCDANGIESVLFAKVDTEGNDMRVLEGATRCLEEGRIRYLQFEYNHRWILFRNYLKDVFELVEPYGYKVAKVTSEGLEVYPEWHFELEVFWEGNYLIAKDFSPLKVPLLSSAIFQ